VTKAILELSEMPQSCTECPISCAVDSVSIRCQLIKTSFHHKKHEDNRHNKCPLKLVHEVTQPEQMQQEYDKRQYIKHVTGHMKGQQFD
jgi:hypothetical protein